MCKFLFSLLIIICCKITLYILQSFSSTSKYQTMFSFSYFIIGNDMKDLIFSRHNKLKKMSNFNMKKLPWLFEAIYYITLKLWLSTVFSLRGTWILLFINSYIPHSYYNPLKEMYFKSQLYRSIQADPAWSI